MTLPNENQNLHFRDIRLREEAVGSKYIYHWSWNTPESESRYVQVSFHKITSSRYVGTYVWSESEGGLFQQILLVRFERDELQVLELSSDTNQRLSKKHDIQLSFASMTGAYDNKLAFIRDAALAEPAHVIATCKRSAQ